MYDYIKGMVVSIQNNAIVLENSGIGYLIHVSNPYSFEVEEEIKVYVYQQVMEDDLLLYGFKTEEEKNLFLKLISVKGLGCKMALPILAVGSPSGIIDAIERENLLYLKKFPKIGDKLAKQMILDLKGKLGSVSEVVSENTETETDLRDVLLGLGYKEKEIHAVIVRVDHTLSLEEQVKECLKLLLK